MTEPTLLVTHTVPPETTEGLLAALRDENSRTLRF
jgi:hypothetical protein